MIEPTSDILIGDVREVLRQIPERTVQVCITSPPYWGLRNYGVEGQLGSEPTVEEFVANMVDVFADVHRVLRDDGSVYLNLGDCYTRASSTGIQGKNGQRANRRFTAERLKANLTEAGCKEKDLIGVPWLVAFALREWGWYLREDIVWHKPNPMPESITDRCTRSHEYLFHLTKSARYFYDHEAIKEPYADASLYQAEHSYGGTETKNYDAAGAQRPSESKRRIIESMKAGTGRNKRDVWTIAVQPYRGGHFATFPEKLVEPCILAASSEGGECSACGTPMRHVVVKTPVPEANRIALAEARKRTASVTGRTDGHTSYKPPQPHREILSDTYEPGCECQVEFVPQVVLDPFVGSGRAGIVAKRLGRSFIGIDLNPDYALQAMQNIEGELVRPIVDKQAGHGRRHSGFNARWNAHEQEASA